MSSWTLIRIALTRWEQPTFGDEAEINVSRSKSGMGGNEPRAAAHQFDDANAIGEIAAATKVNEVSSIRKSKSSFISVQIQRTRKPRPLPPEWRTGPLRRKS